MRRYDSFCLALLRPNSEQQGDDEHNDNVVEYLDLLHCLVIYSSEIKSGEAAVYDYVLCS